MMLLYTQVGKVVLDKRYEGSTLMTTNADGNKSIFNHTHNTAFASVSQKKKLLNVNEFI